LVTCTYFSTARPKKPRHFFSCAACAAVAIIDLESNLRYILFKKRPLNCHVNFHNIYFTFMCNSNDNDNLKYILTHVEKLSSNVCIWPRQIWSKIAHTTHVICWQRTIGEFILSVIVYCFICSKCVGLMGSMTCSVWKICNNIMTLFQINWNTYNIFIL